MGAYADKLAVLNTVTALPDAAADYMIGDEDPPNDKINRAAKENREIIKQLVDGAIGQNLLANGDFEQWSAGASSAPDGWTLAGTGAAVARSATKKRGSYAAQVTYGSSDAYLYRDYADYVYFRGGKVTVGVWVKCSTASIARVIINDGVGSSASSYHTGSGTYELLEVTHTLDAAASQLRVEAHVEGAGNAIFDAVKLEEGEIATAFSPGFADELPVQITMWHDESTVISGNALTHVLDTAQRYNWFSYQNAAADGDTFIQKFSLSAGTYTLSVLGRTGTNYGKIDWYIDNVLQDDQDWYGGAANNIIKTVSITVVGDNLHTIKAIVNGKNASSNDYVIALTKFWIN